MLLFWEHCSSAVTFHPFSLHKAHDRSTFTLNFLPVHTLCTLRCSEFMCYTKAWLDLKQGAVTLLFWRNKADVKFRWLSCAVFLYEGQCRLCGGGGLRFGLAAIIVLSVQVGLTGLCPQPLGVSTDSLAKYRSKSVESKDVHQRPENAYLMLYFNILCITKLF